MLAVVVSDYYRDIAALLFAGCNRILAANAGYQLRTLRTAGAMEIPQAALRHWRLASEQPPQIAGLVALGCVIRGETSHYDIVAHHSAYWLGWLAFQYKLPVTNGILTCDNRQQALSRAESRGAQAGNALLAMLEPQPYDAG